MDQIKYLSQQEAINLDKELFDKYKYSVYQLMELAGLSVATAIAKIYKLPHYDRPIVCCGPGNNGGDGLVCARHLKLFGYSPVVIYLKKPNSELYQNLLSQCKSFNIEIFEQNPSDPDLSKLGNIIVDCVFGFSFKPPNRNANFAKLLNMMYESSRKLPLVSVDIPSGWHVENGYSTIEADQEDIEPNIKIPILKPECLVSLTAPKLCAKHFNGLYHYLGGRFCPPSINNDYQLQLPEYPDCEQVVLLRDTSKPVFNLGNLLRRFKKIR